jgi:hypothetical protein
MTVSRWVIYGAVSLVWLVYAALNLHTSQSVTAESLRVSQEALYLLRLTVDIPFLITWLAAAAGWRYMRQFSRSKRLKGFEQAAYKLLAGGLGLLTLSLITSTFGSSLRYAFYDPDTVRLVTITTNYMAIVLPLAAFGLTYRGATYLVSNSINADNRAVRVWILSIPLSIIAALFGALIFTNPIRHMGEALNQPATYYLSDPIILVTLMLPALVSWFLGLLTVLQLERYLYGSVTKGQQAGLVPVFNGLLAVVSGSILAQAILALGDTRLYSYGLVIVLFLVYLLLLMQSLGYGLIVLGAQRLRRLGDTR